MLLTLLSALALGGAILSEDAARFDVSGDPLLVTGTVVGTGCSDATRLLTARRGGRAVHAHAEPYHELSREPSLTAEQAAAMGCEASLGRWGVRVAPSGAAYDALLGIGYQVQGERPVASVPVLCHHVGYEGGVCLTLAASSERLVPLFTYGL